MLGASSLRSEHPVPSQVSSLGHFTVMVKCMCDKKLTLHGPCPSPRPREAGGVFEVSQLCETMTLCFETGWPCTNSDPPASDSQVIGYRPVLPQPAEILCKQYLAGCSHAADDP